MDRLHFVMVIVGTLAVMVAAEIAVLIGSYLRSPKRRKRLPSERAIMRRLNGSRFWFRRVTAVGDSDELRPSQRREAYSQVLVQSRIDERTAIAAAMGISELAAPATARLVLHAVDEGRLPAFAAAAALAQSIPVDEGNLAALLMGGELGAKAKRVAVATLGERGGEPSVKALVVMLTIERDVAMRLSITRALLGCVVRGGQLPPQVCPRLLSDASPEIRSSATLLAGAALGDQAGVLLFPMLADGSATVAQNAARAICDLPTGLAMVRRFLSPVAEIDDHDDAAGLRDGLASLREAVDTAGRIPGISGKARSLINDFSLLRRRLTPPVDKGDIWERSPALLSSSTMTTDGSTPEILASDDVWERARAFLIAELSLRAPDAHWNARRDGELDVASLEAVSA